MFLLQDTNNNFNWWYINVNDDKQMIRLNFHKSIFQFP